MKPGVAVIGIAALGAVAAVLAWRGAEIVPVGEGSVPPATSVSVDGPANGTPAAPVRVSGPPVPVANGPESQPDEQARASLSTPGIDEEVGNELLNQIARRDPAWLVLDLIAIVADHRHTPRWRNYAVQHLCEHHLAHRDAASRNGLIAAIDSDEPEVRDTAVYSLARLACDFTADDPDGRRILEAVMPRIARWLTTPTTGVLALERISAVRSSVLLRRVEQAPAILRIALDPIEASAARVAAFEALGALGVVDARAPVDAFLRDAPAGNVRRAAEHAAAALSRTASSR